jgi:phytoene desaturase
VGQLTQFLGLKPWQTISDLSKKHLKHERLRQIFDLYAFYNGSSPYKASAIFAIIAWVQWGDGTFYLRGGLRTYADALAKLATKVPVSVQFNSPVRGISIASDVPFASRPGNSRLYGVSVGRRGSPPTHIEADAVISNADPMTTFANMLGIDWTRPGGFEEENVTPSTSAFVMLLGVKGDAVRDFPHLSHFNSFLPTDLKRRVRLDLPARHPCG